MNPDEAAIGVDGISCLEPEMNGDDMYCPEAMVATLDMALDDLVCCAPHDADKLTVDLLSELMVYEDELPQKPSTEKAVGAWWGLLVAGAKKLCTKATAKAVGKHIVKKGKEHVIDSAKDAAWDAAAGAVEDWINPDEAALASVDGISCFEPEVDGEDMYCPEALVPTLDMAEDSLACCAPHEADKLTVDLLSELVVYEDELPKNPNAAEKEVGAWWGLLVAGAKKLCTKATAKAVGKHIVKKGKEHVIDSAKDAAWDAAAGAVEGWNNPDE